MKLCTNLGFHLVKPGGLFFLELGRITLDETQPLQLPRYLLPCPRLGLIVNVGVVVAVEDSPPSLYSRDECLQLTPCKLRSSLYLFVEKETI